jgi:hypothetical protein
MKQRKLPLFIHVDPMNPVVLNKTCRYFPDCGLLIAHQDEIEGLLAAMFAEHDSSFIGNDYLVLGTVERKAWWEGTKQPKSIPEIREHLHDFREVRTIRPACWYPADEPPTQKKRTERPAAQKKWPKRRKRRRSKRL